MPDEKRIRLETVFKKRMARFSLRTQPETTQAAQQPEMDGVYTPQNPDCHVLVITTLILKDRLMFSSSVLNVEM